MYVCFGFSLARLCRARTIDLQCQLLSLCRAFCFAACVCRCVELSRVMPLAGLRARTFDRKSSRKSIESRYRVTHRGTQNRPKIAPGTLSGRPVLSKSVPKASRERFGSVSERPEEAQGAPKKPLWRSRRFFGVPGAPRKSLGGSQPFFGTPKSPEQPKKRPISARREGQHRVFFARRARRPTFARFSLDFRSIFGCSRKSFGERSRGEFRPIFGSSTRSPTLMKHYPER